MYKRKGVPSIKTIEARLGACISHEHGEEIKMSTVKQIRKILQGAFTYMGIDKALDNCNKLLHGYGVEAIRDNKWSNYYHDIGILYCNMGDTYIDTIVFDTRKDKFYITSWGAIVENEQKRFDV